MDPTRATVIALFFAAAWPSNAPAEVRIVRHTALVPALGVTCVSLPEADSCMFWPRFGIDFIAGDLHFAGLVGRSNGNPYGGLQLGLDLGTPYFVAVRGYHSPALAIAVRASLDHDLLAFQGVFARYVFSNTYGPNLAIGLGTRRVSLLARIAVGWSLTANTRADLSILPGGCCAFAAAVDAYLGVLVWL
jgi:hypothetical protein